METFSLQRKELAMNQVTYVGLDVHKNSITAVFGPIRTTPESMVVGNDEKGWNRLAKKLEGFEARAVYEASSCAFEVYEEMTARGWSVEVVAPSHMPKSPKQEKSKTDLKDAIELRSRLMAARETGASLPTVWIPPVEVREDRELVRRRLALGGKMTRAKNSIKSLLQVHKMRRAEGKKSTWTQEHLTWLRSLCGPESTLARTVKCALESMLREVEFLIEEEKRIQRELEKLAEEPRHKAQVTELVKVPGVAALTALTFLTELGDVARFQNRRQLACYLGLTPSTYESGDADDRKGHITKMGPSRIRKVLNQAAWVNIRHDKNRAGHFAKLMLRRGKKKAIVAEMRRLGILLWHRAVEVLAA